MLLATVPTAVLAQGDPAAGGSGSLGLLVIALLSIVTVLLIRNMSRRLKKLPRSFDDSAQPRDDDAPPPSAGSQ